jgi:tripartite-type tricarboxylate transporter receptor subunit TctC
VPFPPGGAVDYYARAVQNRLAETLGQPVLIENRSGASGMVGADLVAKSPPDGYTVLVGNIASLAMNVGLYAKMPYDPVKDLTPIMRTVAVDYAMVVHPSVPAQSVTELVAYAKANPAKLSYGSAGSGSAPHLSMELFKQRAGIDLVHIPFKGGGPMVTDLLGGQIQVVIADQANLMPHVKAGKLRALAVGTLVRSAVYPELPTIAESGYPGFEGRVAGHRRPGGPAAGHRPPASGGDRESDGDARGARAAGRRRARSDRHQAGGVRRLHPRRDREVVEGGEGRRRAGRLRRHRSTSPARGGRVAAGASHRTIGADCESAAAGAHSPREEAAMTRIALALCALAVVCSAHAQGFPIAGKPIRIVVPFPPGGQADIQARAIAQRMTEASGLAVIVDNRPGGSSIIGTREVAKAAPDGHTLLYTIAVFVQLPHLYATPPFDVFKDFTPITTGARSGTVLTAHASMPFNTVPELVVYAKANPGKLNCASFGAGTTSHLNCERLKRQAAIDVVHVPYKGTGDAMRDVLSGAAQIFFDGPTTAIANAKGGRIKLVATATEERIGALPDLPTLREAGYDVGITGYLWFWGPAGMPAATVDAVYQQLAPTIKHPDMVELFAKGGAEASGLPPAETARAARDLYERWGVVIREIGIKLD